MIGRGELALLVSLAAAVRALVALRTAMPGRDAATYLWMAEQVAAGDVGAAFATVFHPLYPLLTGGLLAVAPLPAMAAAQLVAGGASALAVAPLAAAAAHRFGRRAGWLAGICFACGLWFARYPAECMSEGSFHLAAALWAFALLGQKPRPAAAGLAAAAAYAIRPEGLVLLALGAAWTWRGPGRLPFLAAGLGAAALVPAGYALLGPSLTLTPKASFNLAVGAGGAADPLQHYAAHLLRAGGAAFEALGYVLLPLAAAGGVLALRAPATRPAALLLLAPLAAQLLAIPLLRSHLRFWSGFGVLAMPFAGVAIGALWERRGTVWRAAILLLALVPDLTRLPQRRGEDRVVERELGEHLRARLRPGELVATEMPRLEYFAGQRPSLPRPLTREDVLAACRDPRARFAVVVEPRSHVAGDDLRALGFAPLSLPAGLSTLAERRRILVYHRP